MMALNEEEFRRWVIEQAIASFGAGGCSEDWLFERRVQAIANLAVAGTTKPDLKEAA